MPKGDRLGKLVCPCCGGEWIASEQGGGGVTLRCPVSSFQGWAKSPRAAANIRAKLAPAPAAAKPPAEPKPAAPARRNPLAFLLEGDE